MKKILNFRPLLFCALSLLFGLELWGSIRFSEVSPVVILLFGVLLLLALPPFEKKRLLSLLLIVPVFAGIGIGLMQLALSDYEKGLPSGEYTVTATVLSVSERQGYSIAVLKSLSRGGGGQVPRHFTCRQRPCGRSRRLSGRSRKERRLRKERLF